MLRVEKKKFLHFSPFRMGSESALGKIPINNFSSFLTRKNYKRQEGKGKHFFRTLFIQFLKVAPLLCVRLRYMATVMVELWRRNNLMLSEREISQFTQKRYGSLNYSHLARSSSTWTFPLCMLITSSYSLKILFFMLSASILKNIHDLITICEKEEGGRKNTL